MQRVLCQKLQRLKGAQVHLHGLAPKVGKTSIGAYAFPLWAVLFGGYASVLVVVQSATEKQALLRHWKQLWRSERLGHDHPRRIKWQSHGLHLVDSKISITVTTLGSNLLNTPKDYDLILCDGLDRDKPAHAEKVMRFFVRHLKPHLQMHTKLVVLDRLYSDYSLLPILKNYLDHTLTKTVLEYWPLLFWNEERDKIMSLWPDKHPDEPAIESILGAGDGIEGIQYQYCMRRFSVSELDHEDFLTARYLFHCMVAKNQGRAEPASYEAFCERMREEWRLRTQNQ